MIILEIYVKIPQKEKWLFENEAATQSVKCGLKEASEGKLRNLGSFSKHPDKEIFEEKLWPLSYP